MVKKNASFENLFIPIIKAGSLKLNTINYPTN
jgi:hypothetical protein